eukprot:4129236-Amphidinium_carterae.1
MEMQQLHDESNAQSHEHGPVRYRLRGSNRYDPDWHCIVLDGETVFECLFNLLSWTGCLFCLFVTCFTVDGAVSVLVLFTDGRSRSYPPQLVYEPLSVRQLIHQAHAVRMLQEMGLQPQDLARWYANRLTKSQHSDTTSGTW